MKNKKTLFIHATNIHQGGGRTLLLRTLKSLPKDFEIYIFVDARMTLPADIKLSGRVNIEIVKPTIVQRLKAEWRLSQLANDHDVVLCFGSLPPLFKTDAFTNVFVQNKYLIDQSSLSKFPLKTRLRLAIERLWFSSRLCHADAFTVQTPSMKLLIQDRLSKQSIPVHVFPFVDDSVPYLRTLPEPKKNPSSLYDFVYVASGEPHKNHKRLIEAWILLSKELHFPKLALTLDQHQFPDLCCWLDKVKAEYHLSIQNLGTLPHEQVKLLYQNAGALIFPSTLESFGIPLIEARQAGLPVIASELDYVRDILDPEQSFDPHSANSIAHAVKRFLQIKNSTLPLMDAAEFLQQIIRQAL
ncbi:MAG: glycosyltransferase [Bdellovibrionaceae bacterium]|nr:glycosyltransferase [Bdellovibrio sp.]